MRKDKKDLFRPIIKALAKKYGFLYSEEVQFASKYKRLFRFDFCISDAFNMPIAIEVNGQAWSTKGGGRHGKPDDLQKLNLAQRLGYIVLQYGTSKKEIARCARELEDFLSGNFKAENWEKIK